MVYVYALKNNFHISKMLFEQLLDFISENSRDRISKYCDVHKKQQTLLGELLSRFVIQQHHSILNKNITFRHNKFGKPYINGFTNIHFNISHAGCWVVCALSPKPVGIDIEKLKHINFDVGKKVFSMEEFKILDQMEESIKLDYFYKIWSLKESYMKAIGKGFHMLTKDFSFSLLQDKVRLEYSKYDSNCFFRQYPIEKGYYLSLCSFDEQSEDKIKLVNFQNLLHIQ